VTFLRLGKVFSSVITGNLVLLGVAAGKLDAALALNAGLALAGYAGGVVAGAALAGTPELGQPVWPVQVTRALAVESGVLAAFSGEWLAVGGHPAMASRLALLLLAAAAMGLQGTAVRRLGQMSTTYLTSTLTGVISAIALGRRPDEWQRSTADPDRGRDRGHARCSRRFLVSALGPRCCPDPDRRRLGWLARHRPTEAIVLTAGPS
jgi:uncharacterized membrane protein YoaK (UPF0700 family)